MVSSHMRYVAVAVLFSLLSLLPVGCGGGKKEFTPEDFKKVQKDMTEDQVKEILGKPEETLEAGKTKRSFYTVGDKYYSISFTEGKVIEPLGPTTKEEQMMMKALMQAATHFDKK